MKKQLNKGLLDMKKKGKIPVKVYEALMSTGAQPESLCGLAKVHKKETPLRPIRSIPRNRYHKLNFEGTNIETNTNDERKTLEQIKLEKDEKVLSLDV